VGTEEEDLEEEDIERCESCHAKVGLDGARDYTRDMEDGVVFCLPCIIKEIADERNEALAQVAELEKRLAAITRREAVMRESMLRIANELDRKLDETDSIRTVVLVSDKDGP
jgi:hypothetical protein